MESQIGVRAVPVNSVIRRPVAVALSQARAVPVLHRNREITAIIGKIRAPGHGNAEVFAVTRTGDAALRINFQALESSFMMKLTTPVTALAP